MNHFEIVGESWRILWRHRSLWVFGLILALTSSTATDWLWLRNTDESQQSGLKITLMDDETFPQAFNRTVTAELGKAERELNRDLADLGFDLRVDLVQALTVLLIGGLVFYILGKILTYVSDVALIGMVDIQQEDGGFLRARQGWRLGWSISAWRFFAIDILVFLMGLGVFVFLFGIVALFLLPWLGGSEAAIIVGAILTSTLFFLALASMIVGGALLSVLKEFFKRACALEQLGVLAAIRRGGTLVRANLKDIALMFLIQLGIKMIWAPVIFVLVILLIGVATLVGGLSGGIVAGMSSLFSSGDLSVILALAIGIMLFILVLLAPLIFLQGLREVFLSSLWTLVYRSVRSPEEIRLNMKSRGTDAVIVGD